MKNTADQTKQDSLYRKIRSRLGSIDTQAGRMVFGDDNPLTRHIRSSITHNALRIKSNYRRPEGKRLFKAEDMRKKGYMVFEDLYDKKLIETIREKMEAGFENPESHQERTGKYSLMLSRSLIDIPEIKDILQPEIINALCDYYGAYTDVEGVMAWRNYPLDENAPDKLYACRWHIDHRMPTMMKLFYLVHDTSEKDGPFHIMDRETTKRIVRTEYKSRREPGDEANNEKNFIRLTGKAGTILIGNTTHCMHKAGIPESGHYRDIIQFRFFPSSTPLPPDWHQDAGRSSTGMGDKDR